MDTKSVKIDTPVSRRGFISWSTAVLIGITSFCTFMLTILRMPFPSILPGPSGRFKIGRKEEYPPGTSRYFEKNQTYVFTDTQGLYAISTVCTHLGCIVNKDENGFVCPCHGSRYNLDGNVTQGAAPKHLPWYKISFLANGQLEVDKKAHVKPGTKFIV